MNELQAKILAAHVVATAAMTDGLAKWRASLSFDALAHANKHWNGEPGYCGFAWVIIPADENPGFNKAVKAAMAEAGYKLDPGGNLRNLGGGEFAQHAPAHIRDLGAPTGYATKGQCKKNDWQFHGPGSYRGQSMDIKEIGAIAFREALIASGAVQSARVYTRGD